MNPILGAESGEAVRWSAWLGGVINVTREEFADIQRIMRGEPGCDVAEAKAVCKRLGLQLEAMAFKRWTVKVVDEVKQRCEPPNESSSPTAADGNGGAERNDGKI